MSENLIIRPEIAFGPCTGNCHGCYVGSIKIGRSIENIRRSVGALMGLGGYAVKKRRELGFSSLAAGLSVDNIASVLDACNGELEVIYFPIENPSSQEILKFLNEKGTHIWPKLTGQKTITISIGYGDRYEDDETLQRFLGSIEAQISGIPGTIPSNSNLTFYIHNKNSENLKLWLEKLDILRKKILTGKLVNEYNAARGNQEIGFDPFSGKLQDYCFLVLKNGAKIGLSCQIISKRNINGSPEILHRRRKIRDIVPLMTEEYVHPFHEIFTMISSDRGLSHDEFQKKCAMIEIEMNTGEGNSHLADVYNSVMLEK